jgi:uncharacterized protein
MMRSFQYLSCCLSACVLAPGLLASGLLPKPVVGDAVADVYHPAQFDRQKIGGLLGDRMRINLEGRLLHVDEKGLIEGFQSRPGKQEWIGEHAGKFLDAAANTWEFTHSPQLKTLMDRVAHELIAAQEADGYLGTYTDDKRWTAWDVWVHKYDLLGLLAYYRVTGDKSALGAAQKVGDLLINTFGEGKRDIIESGTHVGMAATSVLEPMVYLYRWTGEERYLKFCRYLVASWDQANGPKIIKSLNETGSVFKTANAKAYEMLSNLVGLTELYRITGDEDYLKPVRTAWTDIREKRLYLTGTSSSSEHFKDDLVLPGDEEAHVGEGCVTVTWMQLTLDLFRLTGEAQYSEQLERTVYNQLLGAQDARTGDICYFTPLNGQKKPTPGINCCVSSEPRGISLIPLATWGRQGLGYAISLYTQGMASFTTRAHGTVRLLVETKYPESGEVLIHVEPERDIHFPLRLRVPSWTTSYVASVGGTTVEGKPGEFLVLNRKWRKGDTVKVNMDLTVRAVDGGPSYPDSVAIQRGPQVLALERALNPEIKDLADAGPASLAPSALSLDDARGSLPGTWLGTQAYSLQGENSGKPEALVLVPFADSNSYRVWLKKPPTLRSDRR